MTNLHDLWRSRRARWAIGVGAVVATTALVLPGAVASAGGASAIHVVVDGCAVPLPTPPELIGGHVVVPLRDVAAVVGLAVHWDPATQTVSIGGPSAGSAPTAMPLVATSTSQDPAPAAPPAGTSFTYNGLKYAAGGLVVRPYPGEQTDSGTYWIVEYTITDVSSTPISLPAAQALVLFGPNASQIAADAALSGTAPTNVYRKALITAGETEVDIAPTNPSTLSTLDNASVQLSIIIASVRESFRCSWADSTMPPAWSR